MPTKSKTKADVAPKARPILRRASVLVLTEKHDSAYFLVRDDKELAKVCLSILRGRLKDGWYPSPDPNDCPAPLGFTKESIAGLPVSLRKSAEAKYLEHTVLAQRYEDDLEEHADIIRALNNKDGIRAFQILMDRSAYGYERVSVERLQQTYGEKYS